MGVAMGDPREICGIKGTERLRLAEKNLIVFAADESNQAIAELKEAKNNISIARLYGNDTWYYRWALQNLREKQQRAKYLNQRYRAMKKYSQAQAIGDFVEAHGKSTLSQRVALNNKDGYILYVDPKNPTSLALAILASLKPGLPVIILVEDQSVKIKLSNMGIPNITLENIVAIGPLNPTKNFDRYKALVQAIKYSTDMLLTKNDAIDSVNLYHNKKFFPKTIADLESFFDSKKIRYVQFAIPQEMEAYELYFKLNLMGLVSIDEFTATEEDVYNKALALARSL